MLHIKDLSLRLILKQKKSLIAIYACVLLCSAAVSYFYFFSQQQADLSSRDVTTDNKILSTSLDEDIDDLSQLNILLLGYGGPGHQGPYLTDAIQVLHIDFIKDQAALISIPRDLWVKLPSGREAKINQALTLKNDSQDIVQSNSKIAKDMAQVVTGLEIDYFIGIDFVGFQRLIGITLDGITVNVPERLEDPWYPIRGEELNPCGYSPQEIAELTEQYSGFQLEKQFECRYQHILFEPGPNKMEGADALAYVRSRHGSSDGDFSRSWRQQVLLQAIKQELLSLNALANIPEIFSQVSQHVSTDLNLEILQYLQPALQTASQFEVQSLVLSTENVFTSATAADGQFIVRPLEGHDQWQQVHQFIAQELD